LAVVKALVFAAFLAHAAVGVSADDCMPPEPAELDRLETWDKYYAAYLRHGKCADGVVAGRFLEAAAFMLAWQWETAAKLETLGAQDTAFLRFVAGVLGDSVPMDEWRMIRRNVQTRCTSTIRRVCDALRTIE